MPETTTNNNESQKSHSSTTKENEVDRDDDVEVVQTLSWEETMAQKLVEAHANGDVVSLLEESLPKGGTGLKRKRETADNAGDLLVAPFGPKQQQVDDSDAGMLKLENETHGSDGLPNTAKDHTEVEPEETLDTGIERMKLAMNMNSLCMKKYILCLEIDAATTEAAIADRDRAMAITSIKAAAVQKFWSLCGPPSDTTLPSEHAQPVQPARRPDVVSLQEEDTDTKKDVADGPTPGGPSKTLPAPRPAQPPKKGQWAAVSGNETTNSTINVGSLSGAETFAALDTAKLRETVGFPQVNQDGELAKTAELKIADETKVSGLKNDNHQTPTLQATTTKVEEEEGEKNRE